MRKTKRYNLVLPLEEFQQVSRLAKQRHTTFVALLRQFIKLGILATSLNTTLILREDGKDERVVYIP